MTSAVKLIIAGIVLFLLILILIFVSKNNSLQHELAEQKSDVSMLNKQLKEKDREADLLYNDSAERLSEYTEQYDFSTFGIYSPLFEKKEVKVTEYNYRSSLIKKKVLTLPINIPENYSYKIIIWQFFENEGKESSFGRYDQIFALPEYSVGYERGPYIEMTSIDSVRSIADVGVKNKYGVEIAPISIAGTSGLVSSLIIGADSNPLSEPLFVLIKAEDEVPFGAFGPRSMPRGPTAQMKKIADTLSSRVY